MNHIVTNFYDCGRLEIAHLLTSYTHSIVSALRLTFPKVIRRKSLQHSRHIIPSFNVRPLQRNFWFREHVKITRRHVSRIRRTFQLWRSFLGRKSLPKIQCGINVMIPNSLFFLRFCHFSANALPLTFRIRKTDGFGGTFTVDNCLTKNKS